MIAVGVFGHALSFAIPILVGIFFITFPLLLSLYLLRYKTIIHSVPIYQVPNIKWLLLSLSGAMLAFSFISPYYVYDRAFTWWCGILVAIPVMTSVLWFFRNISFRSFRTSLYAQIIILFMMGYGYGSIKFLNVYFDTNPAQKYAVKVSNVMRQPGKMKTSRQLLKLIPLSQDKAPFEIDVDSEYLKKADKTKQFINISIYNGFLGIRYYKYDLAKEPHATVL